MIKQVTNHNKAYNGHTYINTNHRLANHRPDRLSQNAVSQSWTWEARHALPECTSTDKAIPTCTADMHCIKEAAKAHSSRQVELQKPSSEQADNTQEIRQEA